MSRTWEQLCEDLRVLSDTSRTPAELVARGRQFGVIVSESELSLARDECERRLDAARAAAPVRRLRVKL